MADKAKKKNGSFKYVLYIVIVLVATAIALTISLWGDKLNMVVDAFSKADWRYILIIIGIVLFSYGIDGFIIWVFCRLYTREYKLHQGVATSLVGQFYSDVTPGASGGQVMQVYTLKSQGIQVSNAASIMVMWFILYQTALIIFDVGAYSVEWNQIMAIKNIDIPMNDGGTLTLPLLPFIILGFLLNLSVIALLFIMSYSHKVHNFILHYVIGFFGRIHIIKNPDKTRENLRVQVENFKIELRRLQANIPVVILQIILFLALLFSRYCIPYFAGKALHGFGDSAAFDFGSMMEASFLSAFHQMVTGLIPIPGSAGVSELFYYYLFNNYFGNNEAVVSATQILWRTATFHVMLVVSGFVAALYRSRPKEAIHYANRQTFVDLQLQTYDERKRSSDTMYETHQISKKSLRIKLLEGSPFRPKQKPKSTGVTLNFDPPEQTPTNPMTETTVRSRIKIDPPKKPKREKRKKKKQEDSSWEVWDI